MRLDGNSAAASLLVVLACALVVLPSAEPGGAARCLPIPLAPGKSKARLSLKGEEDAVAWLHSIARSAIANADFKFEGRSLNEAVSLLGLDQVLRLLGDRDYWPEKLVDEQWKRLMPLRKLLLERIAVLDLGRGLDEFPYEARLLVEVAAREDGAAAFVTWLAFKDEWKNREMLVSVDDNVSTQWLEGLGKVPDIAGGDEDFETLILSRLMKGWASSAPEAAWSSLKSHASDSYSDSAAVKSLITGLQEGSDWRAWASRVESFAWPTPGRDELAFPPSPESKSTVALANRWITDDAEAALQWYLAREATWSENYFHVADWSTGTTAQGNSHLRIVPLLTLVYATWLEKRPEEALAYLEKSGHTREKPLEHLVKWTELPDETKRAVLAIMPSGEMKDDAAVHLARHASWTSFRDPDASVARLGEISIVQGLQPETVAKIEQMKREIMER